MMYAAIKENRIDSAVILEISVDAIFRKGTYYSNMNAASNKRELGKTIEYLKNIKFDLVKKQYHKLDNLQKQLYQAEILVKELVPIDLIQNLK